MVGTWQRLAHVELGSDGATLDSGVFTAKENLRIEMSYSGATNGAADAILRVGNETVDSGSNYAQRTSVNGASDVTATSQSSFYNAFCWAGYTGVDTWHYTTINITNIASKEKIAIGNCIRSNTAGAGNVPWRVEAFGKWTNTSAQINRITLTGSGGSSNQNYAAGSYITVWGASDDVVSDEKDALTNVEVGTRYEEIDTRKIYRRAAAGTFTSTDYTTSNFTAVGSTVAITSNSAVSTNTPSNTANRVYATIPSLKSTDAWSCDFQLYVTEDATNDYHTIAFCTNSDAFNTSGQNHVSVQTQGGGYQRFVLNGRIGGSNSETTTSNSTRSLNTNYYITLSSDGANTARMRIWTNSNRTGTPAQDKTLSIANIGTLTTIMHGIRNATSSPYEWSGTVSNVSLTTPAKWIERGTA